MKVLVVEDNVEVVEAISMVFELRWPEVTVLTTTYGEKGVELAKTESLNLIILDLGLPDIDGFQVLRRVRDFSQVPVIILTVRGDEINKIRGLELGADDYMVKPFSPGELLARARAVMRRYEPSPPKNETLKNLIIFGKLRIDTQSREISIGEKSVKLSPRAYDLLNQLVVTRGDFVPLDTLMRAVAAPGEELNPNLVLFLIKKINQDAGEGTGIPEIIIGEAKTGYRLATR